MLEVDIKPTRKVIILGLDRREPENLGFCAITFGTNRLFWADGFLMCLEVYDKSIEREIERGEFYISQLCYAIFPKYNRILEIEKGAQIPVVNVSDMRLYKEIVKAILNRESKC
ncbi:MAG: hypothetical protein QXR84_00610 [Candidatus Bathyarchaeia archaeon]